MLGPLKLYGALLGTYLRPQRGRVLFFALVLLGGVALRLLNPQILRYFIDTAIGQGELSLLYTAALLFVVVGLSIRVLMLLVAYVASDIAWRATNRLRADLLLHVLRLDMTFHNRHTPGELLERIDEDTSTLENFFSWFGFTVLRSILQAIGVLIVVWIEDWRLGLAMTLFAAAYLLVQIVGQQITVPFWHASRQASADFSCFIGERLPGIKDIQTVGAGGYVLRGFHEVMRREFRTFYKARMISEVASNVSNAVYTSGFAVAIALGAYLFRAAVITVGTIFLLIQYLEELQGSLRRASEQVEDLQRARASIERISELFDTRSVVQDGHGPGIPRGQLSVELSNVSFSYNPEVPVLHDVSFRLQPGKTLGLLGRTGSGKTTISRLLFRLYDADKGSIRLGDVDIRDTSLSELRRRVGLVTLEVQLFQASVRDNLTMFDPSIGDDKVLESIQTLGLDFWYRSLREGLDTKLAAGGGQLSAGEAQLLAFARAFLKDPDVVVLDEASSRLDPATERLIEQAVGRLLEGRTGIIIAHRLATLHRVDDIMIFENGVIQEYGARSALMNDKRSRYSQLLRTGLEEVLA